MSRDDQVLADRPLLALGHGAAAVVEVVAHHPLAIAGRGDRGGDGGVEVVHHAVAIGQRVAVAARKRQAARRGLLVGHADRALESRPGIAVARVERVVDLADVIGPAAFVEASRVGAAKQLQRGVLALGDVRVQRIGRRREVVGVVAALLVQVDGDLRHVLEANLDAAACFGLRLREPVAVHVEQVMVDAPARPRLVVLGAVGRRIGRGGPSQQVLEHEPRAAVGVLHGIDQHQRVARHGVDAGIAL